MRQLICGFLTAAMLLLTTPSQAEMLGTTAVLNAERESSQRVELQQWLADERVRAQLEAWGVDSDQAAERVAALTGDELQALAAQMPELPAGGDGAGLLIVGFLIVLLLELLGAIDIFTRI